MSGHDQIKKRIWNLYVLEFYQELVNEKWSSAQIEKIQKQKKNEKPSPEYFTHIKSFKK